MRHEATKLPVDNQNLGRSGRAQSQDLRNFDSLHVFAEFPVCPLLGHFKVPFSRRCSQGEDRERNFGTTLPDVDCSGGRSRGPNLLRAAARGGHLLWIKAMAASGSHSAHLANVHWPF